MARWKTTRVVLVGLLGLLLAVVPLVGACAPGITPTPTNASKEATPAQQVAPLQVEKSPGGYDVVPLEYDEIVVAAVQMNAGPVDPNDPEPGIQRNLERMLYLCDAATAWPPEFGGGPLKLIAFPEFTLSGYDTTWTREDWLRIATMVPGPETEAIGQKAKELDCYIEFANYTQDPDWPGHFFNTSIIVSPEGEVIHQHWKAYAGFPGIGIEYATTVHDVLDEFVERYGWEAVWPVARTPIGNIATFVCSEGFAPETARAFAFNGAEILVRSIGGGAYNYGPGVGDCRLRMISDCAASGVYGVYANGGPAITMAGKGVAENVCGGGTMIIDPSGRILKQAEDSREQIIKASIPIASFRTKHSIPNIRTEIYVPILEQHPGLCPPNLYTLYEEEYGELPPDIGAAGQWSLKHAR